MKPRRKKLRGLLDFPGLGYQFTAKSDIDQSYCFGVILCFSSEPGRN